MDPLEALERSAARIALPGLKLTAKVGRGGFSVVFRAKQLKLGRDVAVKISPCADAGIRGSDGDVASESVALAALKHPNIVQVYDAGVVKGYAYTVMEYVEGTNLRRLSASHDLSVEQIQWIADGICRALAAAHQAGIFHGDIKPENVLIGRRGQLKVVDFGIASMTRTSGVSESFPDHAITPIYASPERQAGQPPDPVSDVFSFGVVCYEMLTLRLPKGGSNRPAAYRPDCPGWLDELVARCLEPRRSDRYSDMGEVLRRLQALKQQMKDSAIEEEVRTRTNVLLAYAAGTKLSLPQISRRRATSRIMGVLAAIFIAATLVFPILRNYNVLQWEDRLHDQGHRVPVAAILVGLAALALHTSAIWEDESRGLLQAIVAGLVVTAAGWVAVGYFSPNQSSLQISDLAAGSSAVPLAIVSLVLGALVSPLPSKPLRIATVTTALLFAVGTMILLPRLLAWTTGN